MLCAEPFASLFVSSINSLKFLPASRLLCLLIDCFGEVSWLKFFKLGPFLLPLFHSKGFPVADLWVKAIDSFAIVFVVVSRCLSSL